MANYNLYPAIDNNYNFPPPVRKALSESPEISAANEAQISSASRTITENINVELRKKIDLSEAQISFAKPNQVPALVAEAIGNNTTVYTAAAAAVETATTAKMNSLDIIEGKDRRVMLDTISDGYAIPFADEDGAVAGGFKDDGSFNFETDPSVMGVKGMVATPINNSDWSYAVTDEDGYVAFGVRSNGDVHISSGSIDPLNMANAAIGYSRSDRSRIACFGDSLTNGYFDGASGKTADSYPTKLQEMIGSRATVFNRSTSGWATDEVAAKIGAIEIRLNFPNNTIPATTAATTVTSGADLSGFRTAAVNINGSVAGIAGNLVKTATGTLTFARKTAGTATPTSANVLFVPEHAGHDADTSIIFLGRNDVGLGIRGNDSSIAHHIVSGVKKIVDWHSRELKQVLILLPTTNTGETKGTGGYETVTLAGRMLRDIYGPKTLDIRDYLVNQAIYDLGITPTTTDIEKMVGDTLPPSIMDPGDGTHYSRATAVLVARQVYNYLNSREWIKS